MKIAARRSQFAEPVAVIFESMRDEMDHLALLFPFRVARFTCVRHVAGAVTAGRNAVVTLQDAIHRQQR